MKLKNYIGKKVIETPKSLTLLWFVQSITQSVSHGCNFLFLKLYIWLFCLSVFLYAYILFNYNFSVISLLSFSPFPYLPISSHWQFVLVQVTFCFTYFPPQCQGQKKHTFFVCKLRELFSACFVHLNNIKEYLWQGHEQDLSRGEGGKCSTAGEVVITPKN